MAAHHHVLMATHLDVYVMQLHRFLWYGRVQLKMHFIFHVILLQSESPPFSPVQNDAWFITIHHAVVNKLVIVKFVDLVV